jgi:hypothetical protein
VEPAKALILLSANYHLVAFFINYLRGKNPFSVSTFAVALIIDSGNKVGSLALPGRFFLTEKPENSE